MKTQEKSKKEDIENNKMNSKIKLKQSKRNNANSISSNNNSINHLSNSKHKPNI